MPRDFQAIRTQSQRAFGQASVRLVAAGPVTRLADLRQEGSARAMLPRSTPERPEVVFLNTSGGLTSGDRIGFALDLAERAKVTATTQTAERAYLAPDEPARLRVALSAGAGADLVWLPQETILFEGSNLERATEVELGDGAGCLLLEMVVLGRRAMGERPRAARLADRRRVTLRGRPLWVEQLRLDAGAVTDSAAVLGGGSAFATLAFCGSGREAAVDSLRAVAVPEGVTAAVSGWNGRCLLRAVAAEPWPLKLYLGAAMARLTGRPLPRVWQMQGVTP
ncbi:urease accessory protein UreD [Rhodobacter sp. SY28-1]|uniref:urease accessory protein UreD n=1 Tax=Rhodobacter sp. SY28-1 TaxID=2562317 RepID=UPI00148509E2|nr:urease accessory protein UreD [Rhodobacter sp. SY28-1]